MPVNYPSRDRLILAFARVEPAGLIPVMPGTFGSLAGVFLAPFLFMPLGFPERCILLFILFIAGALAGNRAEKILGKKDPGEVVIDEVFGQWATYLPFASLSWPGYLAGFFFFRLFDITKPWPVNASENWLPGGWGIMIDDALAAVYAMPCLYFCLVWL